MIGLYNRDSSFFEVTLDSKPLPENVTKDISDKIISFTYEEEYGKMDSGSLTILDPDLVYSSFLKQGKPLTLSWGYKQRPIFLSTPIDNNEMWGEYRRKNVKAIAQFPSGSATENGVITFNCNFISGEFMRGVKNRTWVSGHKRDVISHILTDMGFSGDNQIIDFHRGNEKIDANTAVTQNKSNFKFLCQLAYEWGAVFKTAHSLNGPIALFADRARTDSLDRFASRAGQAISGQSITLDYKIQTALNTTMVKSWSYNQSGGGSGDNIQIVMGPNGTPEFRRYITKNEKTLVYKFYPEKVEAALKNVKDIGKRIELGKSYVNIDNFQDVLDRPDTKDFFTLEMDSTAPQGVGWTVNCKTLGNPMLTVPMLVNFGKVDPLSRTVKHNSLGWPDQLLSENLGFRIQKVTHTITTAGYECDLNIVDWFTISGGALI